MNFTAESFVDSFYNITAREWSAFKENFSDFVGAVDWKEPLVAGTIAFHVVMLLLALLTRKKSTVQAVLFFTLLGIVYCAKYINDYMLENWRLFTKRRYFEESGFFISIMMSAPLLLITFIILINFLLETMNVLVEVKTKQLKQKIKNDKRKAEKESKKDK